jgi:hypothetical protein
VLLPTIVVYAAVSQGAAAAVPTGDGGVTPVTQLPVSHLYRGGLVVGLELGGGIGGASGYPNNSSDIGNPADYSASGFMFGTYESIFVMGAFSDYVSFGFQFGHNLFRNPDFYSNGDGVGFRLEGFPLVGLFPRLQGLGVLAQFGLGTGDLVSRPPNLPEAEGTQSYVGAGVFHEWTVNLTHSGGAHLGIGPSLQYDAIFSRPFESHGLLASLRLVLYTAR